MKGWFGESWRHSLAARGVGTSMRSRKYMQRRRRDLSPGVIESIFQSARGARRSAAAGARTDVSAQRRLAEGAARAEFVREREESRRRARRAQEVREAQAEAEFGIARDALERDLGLPSGTFTDPRFERRGARGILRVVANKVFADASPEKKEELLRKIRIVQADQGNLGRFARQLEQDVTRDPVAERQKKVLLRTLVVGASPEKRKRDIEDLKRAGIIEDE